MALLGSEPLSLRFELVLAHAAERADIIFRDIFPENPGFGLVVAIAADCTYVYHGEDPLCYDTTSIA